MFKPVRKAVFPVAGLGTRFLPATRVMPKEMLTLVDKPLIQHAVEEARAAGIEEFVFVTGRGKGLIEDHFDGYPELNRILEARGNTDALAASRGCELHPGSLYVTRQPEPLGLGHAIWCAKGQVGNEPFAVVLPDDVFLAQEGCLAQMIAAYNETGGNMMAVMDVPRDQTHRYGILEVDSDDGKMANITGMVEKPKPEDAPSTLSIIGRYILQPEIFTELEKRTTGAGGEIQLTDAMARLIGQQKVTGFRFDGERYDCGSKTGFIEATLAFAAQQPDLRAAIERVYERIMQDDTGSRTGTG